MKALSLKYHRCLKKALPFLISTTLSVPVFAGWTTNGSQVLDPNGNPFVFRGVTIDHMVAPERTLQAIKDAAAAGANSVQVEISSNPLNRQTNMTAEQLSGVIQACKENKVVCVLEPNDTAGYSDAPGSIIPSVTSLFWRWPAGIPEVIAGQQDYVIIAVGNQAIGAKSSWEYSFYLEHAINDLRTHMPDFLVIVDGNNWGQDTDNAMLDFAKRNANSPLTKNIIYSVEMFNTYSDSKKIRDYIAAFSQVGAPLLIGGFAPVPYYHPHGGIRTLELSPNLPADSVMEYAQQYGVGYFAWGWSGNANSALDLVSNWDLNALTTWGNLAINGVNGIKATAKQATHFVSSRSSTSSSSSSSSSSSNRAPSAVLNTTLERLGCTGRVSGVGSALGSVDPDGDTLTYSWEVSNNVNSSIYTAFVPTVRFAMEPFYIYTLKLTVNDGKGGTATVSKNLSHSFSGNCSSSSSSVIRSSSSSKPSSVSSSSKRPSSASSSLRYPPPLLTTAICSYAISGQWDKGFTAVIRVQNISKQTLNGWSVNWQYSDGSKVTHLWNANLSGSNPYTATNLGWNANVQPGQTVEFGFQGSKPVGAATIPEVTGGVCH